MTAPSGILDFLVLEASEYIEQLDGLVLAGGTGGPNAESFQRAARALRGSATMARLNAFAGLAIQSERPFYVGHWIKVGGFEGRVAEALRRKRCLPLASSGWRFRRRHTTTPPRPMVNAS